MKKSLYQEKTSIIRFRRKRVRLGDVVLEFLQMQRPAHVPRGNDDASGRQAVQQAGRGVVSIHVLLDDDLANLLGHFFQVALGREETDHRVLVQPPARLVLEKAQADDVTGAVGRHRDQDPAEVTEKKV